MTLKEEQGWLFSCMLLLCFDLALFWYDVKSVLMYAIHYDSGSTVYTLPGLLFLS